MKTLIITIGCVATLLASTQSVQEDFEKLNTTYAEAKAMSMDINIRATADRQMVTAQKGVVKYAGNRYFSKFDHYLVAVEGKQLLMVDLENKTVVYNEMQDALKNAKGQYDVQAMVKEHIANNASLYRYEENTATTKRISVPGSAAEGYDRMYFTIDPANNTLTKVEYTFPLGVLPYDMLTIDYNNISIGRALFDRSERISHYVRVSANKVQATAALSGFEIIDQRNLGL